MGDKADIVFQSFHMSDEQSQSFNAVLDRFDKHFVIRRNIIFERAKFNMRKQQAGESSEAFITDLHKLSEFCEYGELHDDLVRDRIVVGVRDDKLSEKLQLDSALTLEKAISIVRQSEQVRLQQSVLRGTAEPTENSSADVNHVNSSQHDNKSSRKIFVKTSPSIHSSFTQQSTRRTSDSQKCNYCGKNRHSRDQCPARDLKCHACSKIGHFRSVCRSSKHINVVEDYASIVDTQSAVFLDAIESTQHSGSTIETEAWYADICVNDVCLVRFKLDTGADVTVLPAEIYRKFVKSRLQQPAKVLYGPERTRIDIMGMFTAKLSHKEFVVDTDVYVARSIATPLLSRDAINKLHLLGKIDSVSTYKDTIKAAYPSLFTGLGCMPGEYQIRLATNVQPHAVYAPRRVPIPLQPKLKAEIDKLLQFDVIEKVDEPTPWCAPIVVVPKPSGDIRLCVDFTKLNESVLRERLILPTVDQILAQLKEATVFSKLDCNSGFHQIRLSPDSALLTTFITPFGRFCYKRLPMGISSASEYFQKRMFAILDGLPGVACLIDDVLIYGSTQAEHDDRLHHVLCRLRDAGVTLNNKCLLSVDKISFVGHVISSNGIQADPEKVAAIANMQPPTDVSGVRCLLGMVNQLSKFSPELANISAPIRELLHKNTSWSWSSPQDKAFQQLKKVMCSTPTLALFDTNKPTIVSADASSYGLGACIKQQQPDESWRPVAYASRSLSESEKRYAQIEKEALAVTWACERFSDYLIGLLFKINTDHKPLIYLLSSAKSLDVIPPRIQRFRIRLMRFSYTIDYVPGASLKLADALSRLPSSLCTISDTQDIESYVIFAINALPIRDPIMEEIRQATASDPALQLVAKYCQSLWPDVKNLSEHLRPYGYSRDNLTFCNGIVMNNSRVVVPSSLRSKILDALHAAHQGIDKCREKARSSVWWPKISLDIENHVASCSTCAHFRHNVSEPLICSQLPDLPWQKIAFDLFQLNDKHYIVAVDYYSRFIELLELRSQTTECVVSALKSIFARHGVPMTCFSDNGPCFTDQFRNFATEYNFQHLTSSPRYPQSNGEAERAVQTAKNLLRKSKDPYMALLALRTTPNDTGFSPAQLLMGRQLRSNLPIAIHSLQPRLPSKKLVALNDAEAKQRQKVYFDRRHRAQQLPPCYVGDSVWITDLKCLASVTKVLPHRSYLLRSASGRIIRRNGKNLRTPLPQVNRQPIIPENPLSLVSTSPRCHLTDAPPAPAPSHTTCTRSGRIVKPPNRLNL